MVARVYNEGFVSLLYFNSSPLTESDMSGLQSLKVFVQQRLAAAVEEIFGHFERTITEYEEELGRRHRNLLDVGLKRPERKLRRAGQFPFCCWERRWC